MSAVIWLYLKIQLKFNNPVMRVPDNIFLDQYINKLTNV